MAATDYMPDRPFAVLNDWDIAVLNDWVIAVLNDWDIAARHPHPDDSLTPRPSNVFALRPSIVFTLRPLTVFAPRPSTVFAPRPLTVPNAFTAIEVLRPCTTADVLPPFTTADALRPCTTADVLRVSIAADDVRASTPADVPRASTTADVPRAFTTADAPRASTTIEPCSPNAGADHLFHHDRPTPVYDHPVTVYHPDRLVPVYNHDLEALICIFVWVVCCRDDGLADYHDGGFEDCRNGGTVDCRDAGVVDCHDGQPRLNPLVRVDSHEVLAGVGRCLESKVRACFESKVGTRFESKESFLSPITRWNGCKPAAEWGTPIPLRDLLFAIPAQPSTIWTAAGATWETSGPATTPAEELDGRDWTGLPELTVTPSALASCMLSYATGRIGERDPTLARLMSQSCVEDRLGRESSSMKVSEGSSRKVYMKNDVRAAPKDDLRAARKDDALGKAFANDPGKALADDPGKAWNDYKEMISKCVMAQDDGFRGVLNDGLRGVLNDWDLAVDPSDPHAPTASTTPSMPSGTTPLMPFGTPPFMAVDMLEEDALKGKVERLYRHDLESLFYVLTWAAYCYTDGRRCYEDGRRCCNDARRLDPLPEMFERWALGGFSIRPRDFMAYEDPYPLQTCRNSKFAFISGGYQWPRDILPAGEPEDIPWREAGYIAEGLRFFMEDKAERRAVKSRPAGRAYQRAAMRAVMKGKEPPPRPREADEPERMWEGFCAAVREVIEDIISVFNSNTRL